MRSRSDRTLWYFSHLGKTYYFKTKKHTRALRKGIGFYGKEKKKHR
jgi:YHS domain-containing protein